MVSEEDSKKNREPQMESGTQSASGVSDEVLQTQLVNLLGYKAKADEEIVKSEQFRSESVTRLDNIEKQLNSIKADQARIESILRVSIGLSKDELDRALLKGGVPVSYKGSDGKIKEFMLEKLRLRE